MHRRLAAIVSFDVVGYSRLIDQDEVGTHVRVQSLLDVVVSDNVKKRDGHIVKQTGDGALVTFESVVNAVECSIAIQNELAALGEKSPTDASLSLRIGVNLGDIIIDQGDVYGQGVIVAVRLQEMAKPGQVCISKAAVEYAQGKAHARFEPLGTATLKNIEDPVDVFTAYSMDSSKSRHLAARRKLSPKTLTLIAGLLLAVLAISSVLIFNRTVYPTSDNAPLSTPSGQPSLVVAPFNDISPKKDQQYFADGISEELITALEKFPDLFVIGRTSSFKYKDSPQETGHIGKDLGVRYVVQGSVQRSDDRVRVTAQLVDEETGENIWADRYDRPVHEILSIRDEITGAIAGTLLGYHGKLAKAEMQRLTKMDPGTFTAYDFVMRGWYEWYKLAHESNLAARDLFTRAANVDPTYAPAYAGLAWTYANEYDFEWTDDFAGTAKLALHFAGKAARADPNDYRSHWALGWAYLYNWEHDSAYSSYLRARELNPNDAELMAEMANLLIYIGEPSKAIEQLKTAIYLNPLHDPFYEEYLGWAYEEADMPLDAIRTLKQTIGPNPAPEDLWLLYSLTAAYANPKVQQLDKAAEVNKTILALEPTFSLKKYADFVRETLPYRRPQQVERWIGALDRSGLPE